MNKRFLFWSVVLIISLVTTGICTRILALQNSSFSQSLVLRGFSCLIITTIFAFRNGLSLRPRVMHTQIVRALIAGLALSLFSMSYKWLSASTVSVLSNIDVPLLVLFGPLIGTVYSKRSQVLSALAILLLVWYVSGLEVQDHLPLGLTILFAGNLLLCFGYLMIKKSMSEENEAIVTLVPSLALIFYGVVQFFCISEQGSEWTLNLLCVGLLSGVGMYGAYIATMRLYSLADIATAEFPTLISALVMQPLELVILNEPLQSTYLLSSIGIVIVTYFILKLQRPERELGHV